MEVELYRRASELFKACFEMSAARRAAFLDERCARDAELRREVESLLDQHERDARSFGTSDAGARGALAVLQAACREEEALDRSTEASRAVPLVTPATIGSYRILGLLGHGGMGIVYLAEQENPRRTVALKVLEPSSASPRRCRRLEHEAQMLARLHHPGIAQVYEAGLFETNLGPQPYFAMELVRGRALTEHAEARELGMRDRLSLFVQVCRAVEHAHEHGVLHRDLKPANILVDESGAPKVLDFGIARAIGPDFEAATLSTDAGQIVGTLPYMSPEQVSGETETLDARSDVYALGVIGYELVSGRLPCDVTGKPIHEALRAIREDEPTPLSSTNRMFRGDLETIFAKALEKDKQRRYASVRALAGDVERFLSEQPIVARPPSTLYQIAKFARRNRVLVGGIAAVLVVLVLGILGTSWQAIEARAQRNDAVARQKESEREARHAKAALKFLTDMFDAVDPNREGREVKVIDVLRRAEPDLEKAFVAEPRIEASLRYSIGCVYHRLGLWKEGEAHVRRALELFEREYGADDVTTRTARTELAFNLVSQARLDEAEGIFDKIQSSLDRAHDPDFEMQQAVQGGLGHIALDRGDLQRAATILGRVYESYRDKAGEEDPKTLQALAMLAETRTAQARLDESTALMERGLSVYRRLGLEESPRALLMANNLACAYEDQGRLVEAEALYEWVLERNLRVLGEAHDHTLGTMNNLALMRNRKGDLEGAGVMLERLLQTVTRTHGEAHPHALTALNSLALLRWDQGRIDEALVLLRKNIAIRQGTESDVNSDAFQTRLNLATQLEKINSNAEAEAWFREAADCARDALPASNWMRPRCAANYASFLMRRQRHAEAEPWMLRAHEEFAATLGPQDARTLKAARSLVDLYVALGDTERADLFRAQHP